MTPTRQARPATPGSATGPGGIGLRVWISAGIALATVLVLAVAFGLSQSSSKPDPTGAGSAPIGTGGFPTPEAPTDASPGAGPTVGLTARSVATRLCRAELPSALATARLATATADSQVLVAATVALEQAIETLTTVAVGERRWAPVLRSGRAAVAQWRYAVRAAPQEFGYRRGRAAGITLAEQMQTRLAALGVRDCRV